MRVLVACEFSGIVRDAFAAKGHDAWSCDILPTEGSSSHHIECNVLNVLDSNWDLIIAHPPCTYLANSGVRWLYRQGTKDKVPERWKSMQEGAAFFKALLDAPAPKVAVENPIIHCHAKELIGRGPDQTVQPWWFGHGETKATCLWLKGLPLLEPTDIVDGRKPRVHHASPGPERWKERSRTMKGLAEAMAQQWGDC